MWLIYVMMRLWHGRIFFTTGHLCGESSCYQWIPNTKGQYAELCWFLCCWPGRAFEQTVEWLVKWGGLMLIQCDPNDLNRSFNEQRSQASAGMVLTLIRYIHQIFIAHYGNGKYHDDVMAWAHFLHYWQLVQRNYQLLVVSQHHGPVIQYSNSFVCN